MYLITKGLKPRPICRECRKLHSQKDCPALKVCCAICGCEAPGAENPADGMESVCHQCFTENFYSDGRLRREPLHLKPYLTGSGK